MHFHVLECMWFQIMVTNKGFSFQICEVGGFGDSPKDDVAKF